MRIGWIGTGIMGCSMCRHLIEGGHTAVVYNRTRSKTDSLVALGAKYAPTPAEVAKESDVVFTMVGFPADVENVYFGENGIFEGLAGCAGVAGGACVADGAGKGPILVDMTTTKPSLAVKIYEKAKELGLEALDAPVSGGDSGAKNATLSIMVGGDASTLAKVEPLFKLMGKSIVLEGVAGAGQHTKMANQIQIAGTMVGLCEAFAYSKAAGLDLETMVATISKGAAGCFSLDSYAPRIIKGDYAPGFIVEHFVKDMKIAIEESHRMGLELKGLELVESMYEELCAKGYGRCGTQALVKVIGDAF
jgi:3-hydroxyisobutyrate dehydrogenase